MLSDLLTSSRGPGVIGTLLALVVLVGFGGLTMVVFNDNTSGKGLGAQIKDKEAAIRNQEARVKHWQMAAVEYDARRKQADKLDSLSRRLGRKQAAVAKAKTGVDQAKTKILRLVEEFESYKERYRVAERAKSAGEKMAKLTTKDGKVYEQVKVLEVTAIGMKIMHKSGTSRVEYHRLPDEIQDRFQFTKEGAAKIEQKEAAQVARSVQKAEGYQKAVIIRDLKHKIRVNRENIDKWTTKTKTLQAEILSNDSAIEAATASARQYREMYARGSRGLTMDKAKKAERRAERYRKRSAAASREISAMANLITRANSEISSLQAKLQKAKAE